MSGDVSKTCVRCDGTFFDFIVPDGLFLYNGGHLSCELEIFSQEISTGNF